jgi:hypothetical protein
LSPGDGRVRCPDIKYTDDAELDSHEEPAPYVDYSTTQVSIRVSCNRVYFSGRALTASRETSCRNIQTVRGRWLPRQGRMTALCSDPPKRELASFNNPGDQLEETHLLREICTGIGEAETANKLSAKDCTGYLRSSKLEACEAVPISGSYRELLFQVVGVDNSGQSLLRVDAGRCPLESPDRLFCIVESILPDKIPRRL